MVNGTGGAASSRRGGRLEAVSLDLDEAGIPPHRGTDPGPAALQLGRSSPMVGASTGRLRLRAVIPPLRARHGPCVTIRRFGARPIALEEFGAGDAGTAFLRWAVDAGWNFIVSGGTSSGKTTLLNAVSGAIDPAERVITIEETAELRLVQPHVVRLEARPANAEGAGAVSVRDLVRTALRMRPDRIIVGEVRGAEALDLLQALNTGHEGALSTVHANGPLDALRRVATLTLFSGVALPFASVCEQVSAAVDGVVQVERGRNGERRIVAIAEVRSEPEQSRSSHCSWRPAIVCSQRGGRRADRRRGARSTDAGWFE
jgi:pilus assembly protein CpaF